MWIQCEDRLPEPLERVVVGKRKTEWGEGEVEVAYHSYGRWWSLEDDDTSVPTEWPYAGSTMRYWTHWMPLPEPPTD